MPESLGGLKGEKAPEIAHPFLAPFHFYKNSFYLLKAVFMLASSDAYLDFIGLPQRYWQPLRERLSRP